MESDISLHDRRYRRAGGVSWYHDHLVISWGGVVEHRYRKPKVWPEYCTYAHCHYNFVMHTQGPNRAPSCGNSFHEPRLLVTFDPVTRAWAELVTGGQVTHV